MGRPRKPLAPSTNGKAPRPPDIDTQIRALNQREIANRVRTRAREKIVVLVPIARKEAYLDLAERHNEDLSVVIRACIEFGFAHFSRFASAAGTSPFVAGSMDKQYEYGQRPAHIDDPLGTAWPVRPQTAAAFATPQMPFQRPVERVITESEQVFGKGVWDAEQGRFVPPPTFKSTPITAYLPNGATVNEDSPPSPPPEPPREPAEGESAGVQLGFAAPEAPAETETADATE